MYTQEQQEGFLETISTLLTDNETILIDAKKANHQSTEPLSQRCILKKNIEHEFSLKDWFFSGKKQENPEELTTSFAP